MSVSVAELNSQFALNDTLEFIEGPGGLPQAHCQNAAAQAVIGLNGGQVLSFTPNGADDLLFVSKLAHYAAGKATKGGIPVCWPWFGPAAEAGLPAHGFARTSVWQVSASKAIDAEHTLLELKLEDDEASRKLWPYGFDLRLQIEIGPSLKLQLISTNTGSESFTLSQALHTYFRVADIAQVKVSGLEGSQYIDKLDGDQLKDQNDAITISARTDRIYTSAASPLVIEDASLQRQISITAAGHSATVVWNPWIEQALEMGDFDNEEYHHMICVESANAGDATLEVAAGQQVTLAVEYQLSA